MRTRYPDSGGELVSNNALISTIAALVMAGAALAQAPTQNTAQKPFQAGEPLSATNEAGKTMTMSSNVKVYGSFNFAESCTFDPTRNLIVAMNAANPQNLVQNDGFVSLLNPDGSVHTSKWIGVTRDGLTLNHPLGSAISGNTLYAADIDTVRTFDLTTGRPGRAYPIPGASILNGIGVTKDGVIYVSNTRDPEVIYRIRPDGAVSDFIKGPPLALPNGVAIDAAGNVVVVNVMNNSVLTFSPEGQLIGTEHAAESGNDGLVVTRDGTKYVSSVRYGSVSRIRSGHDAEVIATGIPSAASMCYDSKQNQLVIPMNANNALAFIKLRK
jgi:hypothetical protein